MKRTIKKGEIPVELNAPLNPYLIDEVSENEYYFADKSGLPGLVTQAFTATSGQTAFTVNANLDARDLSELLVTVITRESFVATAAQTNFTVAMTLANATGLAVNVTTVEESVAIAGQTDIVTVVDLPLDGDGVTVKINDVAVAFEIEDANTIIVAAMEAAKAIEVTYVRSVEATVTPNHTVVVAALLADDAVEIVFTREITPSITGLHTLNLSARTVGDTVTVSANSTTEKIRIEWMKKTGTIWRRKVANEYWENRTSGVYAPVNG